MLSDQDFLSMMQAVWNIPGLIQPKEKPFFGGYKSDLLQKLEERTHR